MEWKWEECEEVISTISCEVGGTLTSLEEASTSAANELAHSVDLSLAQLECPGKCASITLKDLFENEITDPSLIECKNLC